MMRSDQHRYNYLLYSYFSYKLVKGYANKKDTNYCFYVYIKYVNMKNGLLLALLFSCSLARAQVNFIDTQRYNLRMSDGAKAIVNSMNDLITGKNLTPTCTVNGVTSLPSVYADMPSIFIHYMQYTPNEAETNLTFATFFDETGTKSPDENGIPVPNTFGIVYADATSDNSIFTNQNICLPKTAIKKFAGSQYGAGNWRLRLIKETDLQKAMHPYPNNCTDTATAEWNFISGIYKNSEHIRSVDINTDIDRKAGILTACVHIPYDDPAQWNMFGDHQNMYGIMLQLKEKSTGSICNYYLVSNFEGGDLIMKDVNIDAKPSKGPEGTYSLQISAAGNGVVGAIIDMIKKPRKTDNTYEHYSCGSLPIAYLYPTRFDPNCRLIDYKFQCDWIDTNTIVKNSFNLNIFAVAAPCMLPHFEVPCNYSCILNGYSNQVWSLRLIEDDILQAFLISNPDSLNPYSGNALQQTLKLNAADIRHDIDTSKPITAILDYITPNIPLVYKYVNYPYNSLGIKLKCTGTDKKTHYYYIISDYDGSSTLLWKELQHTTTR